MQLTAPPDVFQPGSNCWRVARAHRASVLIDGENYFRNVRKAMIRARQRIVMVGWDFDTRVEMHDTQESQQGPLQIGDFIDWLVRRNPELHIYLLRWDTGAMKSAFRGSMIFKLLKWQFHSRIHLQLDDKHPAGAAQHQKIITIDNDVAFCGGIDITDGRWDTRKHEDQQSYRKQPNGDDSGPWHDAAIITQGSAAEALALHAEIRWDAAGGKKMAPVVTGSDCWPDELLADFNDINIAIARTQPEMADQEEHREIENLYIDLINNAEDHIYAESQYFASRRIAAAIAARLDEPNGPEVVILNPASSEGWLEPEVMDTARARIVKTLQDRDIYSRFRLYHAVNEVGDEIYIHAKVLIVDDRFIRIGSSNINNRSMGFDSECDLAIDAGASGCQQISNIRNDLLAEHLSCNPDEFANTYSRTGSIIEAIQTLRKSGRTLRDYQVPNLSSVEKWLADNEILDPEDPDENFAGLIK